MKKSKRDINLRNVNVCRKIDQNEEENNWRSVRYDDSFVEDFSPSDFRDNRLLVKIFETRQSNGEFWLRRRQLEKFPYFKIQSYKIFSNNKLFQISKAEWINCYLKFLRTYINFYIIL